MAADMVKDRDDVAQRYKWNRESLYDSDEAWEADYAALEARLPELKSLEEQLKAGPAELLQALEEVYQVVTQVGPIILYPHLTQACNTMNQQANEQRSQAFGLLSRLQGEMAFLEPALLELGQERLNEWMTQEPGLSRYQHYVENLFRAQTHVRSAEIEALLGLVQDPFSATQNTFSMLTNADFSFPPALAEDGRELALTQGSLDGILAGSDRQARRTAWENYHDQYLANKNALASNLAASIKQNVFMARARRHDSTLSMALFEHNVPEQVFHNLLDTFQQHLPTWQRYWRVRRRALGVERLHPYDIWAPLSKEPPRVSFEQAVDWISDGLAPLGEDYVNTLRRGCLEDRWVDVYPCWGKRAGAFSSGMQGTHPFIVMNFVEDIGSFGTLAHELGHSMHSYLSWQTQPPVYARYSLFAAEVASNFHQAMARAHLLEQELAPELELAVLAEAMDNFHRYFLIMPTLARFELAMHRRAEEGRGLTADLMINTLADFYAEAYGDDMELDRERVGIGWATFGHLYSDYYVFQYATGISAANALAKRVRDGGPAAAQDYLGFLKAGSSLYPIDALKQAGVDMSRPEPVAETFQVLDGLIDRIEALTG